MPKVSAIIVNYNAGTILNETVNLLLDSAPVAQVIVVDNGSTDHSMEAIERMALSRSDLICICNNKNLGFARACNIGVVAAGENDYLLFLNPDCLPAQDALEKLLIGMKSSQQTGMAGPLVLNPDGTEQPGGRRAVPTPWRSFIRAFGLFSFRQRYPRLFSDFLLHQQPLPVDPVEVEAISGSCMLVNRAALKDVGLLDEGYFLHCEDLDWYMRFRQRGWKIMFVPDAQVVHHKGTCSKARPIFVEWHKHKGMMRFYGKFFRHQYPGILMWIVAVGVWLRFGAMAVSYSVRLIGQRLTHD
jgi:GT2 family glycosyltransferase